MQVASHHDHLLVPIERCQFIIDVRWSRRVGAALAEVRYLNRNLIVTDAKSLDSIEHPLFRHRYFVDRDVDAFPEPLNTAFSGSISVAAFMKVQRPFWQIFGAKQSRRRRSLRQSERMQIRTVCRVSDLTQFTGFFLPGQPVFEQPVLTLRV